MPAIYCVLFLTIFQFGPGILYEYWDSHKALMIFAWGIGLFHLYMVHHNELFSDSDTAKDDEPDERELIERLIEYDELYEEGADLSSDSSQSDNLTASSHLESYKNKKGA